MIRMIFTYDGPQSLCLVLDWKRRILETFKYSEERSDTNYLIYKRKDLGRYIRLKRDCAISAIKDQHLVMDKGHIEVYSKIGNRLSIETLYELEIVLVNEFRFRTAKNGIKKLIIRTYRI